MFPSLVATRYPKMSFSDREVLVAIYSATGGPRWMYRNGWATSADISSWASIKVRDGSIVGLYLSANNLRGNSFFRRPL